MRHWRAVALLLVVMGLGIGIAGCFGGFCLPSVPPAPAMSKMYVANTVNYPGFVTADLDGGNPEVIKLSNDPSDKLTQWIALDTAAGKMYVTDRYGSVVIIADLDGSNATTTTAGGTLNDPAGIALDIAAGKMYVANRGTDTVTIANLDGSNATTVSVGMGTNNAGGIALDVAAGRMYIVCDDSDTSFIFIADLDGSNVSTTTLGGALTGSASWDQRNPRGIALDIAAGKMYVTTSGNHSLTTANLDGTNASTTTLGGNLVGPRGIALDIAAGKMYVVNYNGESVTIADLDGSNVSTTTLGGLLSSPCGIALGSE